MIPTPTSKAWVPGWFYLVQLIPEFKPTRIKFGFTTNLESRIAGHHTSAPTATVLRAFPCISANEKRAIAALTRSGSTQLGSESFDVDDLDALITAAEAYFAWTERVAREDYTELLRVARSRGRLDQLADFLSLLEEGEVEGNYVSASVVQARPTTGHRYRVGPSPDALEQIHAALSLR